MPITTQAVSSNPVHSEVFLIQHYVIMLMLLDSVLINFICNCVLCMHGFAFMYDYVYMSLCFILMSVHACFVLFFTL